MFFRRTDPIADRLQALGIPQASAGRLSRAGTLLDVSAGTRLCARGERGTQAFLLLEGTAEVTTSLGHLEVGPGAVVGEIATLDPSRHRNADVVTTTPVSLLVFDVATFRSLAVEDDLAELLAPRRAPRRAA